MNLNGCSRFSVPGALAVTLLVLMQIWLPNLGGVGLQLPYNGFALVGYCGLLLIAGCRLQQCLTFRWSPLLQALLLLAALDGAIYLLQHLAGLEPFYPLGRAFLLLSMAVILAGMVWQRSLVLLLIWAAVQLQSAFALVFLCYHTLHTGEFTLRLPVLFAGVFQQPNVFSSFLATGLAVTFMLAERHMARWQRGLLLLSMITSCFLLIVIQSRLGWLALALVIVLMLWHGIKVTQHSRRWLIISLGACVLGVLIGWGALSVATEMRREMGFVADPSGNMRTQQLYLVWRMSQLSPWLGVGLGHFEAPFAEMAAIWFREGSGFLLPNLRHPHNEMAFWLAESGWLGLGGLLTISSMLLWRWCRAGLLRQPLLLALLLPIALHSLTEYPLYQSLPHWLVWLLLAGFVEQQLGAGSDAQWRWRPLYTLLVGAVALGTMLYALYSIYFGYQMRLLTEKPLAERVAAYATLSPPPHWRRDFERQFYTDALSLGYKQHNPALVRAYVDWAESVLPQMPELDIYRNLIFAYRLLEQPAQVERVLALQLQRYPAEWLAKQKPTQALSNAESEEVDR